LQRWHSAVGRYRNLRKLGVNPELARVARSGRGAWRIARGLATQSDLSNRILRKYGCFVPTDLG